MILSHRHKFIFIKTRKTAGTSIEMALSALCGPEDVLTPDHLHTSEDDVLLSQARNYAGPFNPLRELLAARSGLDAARVLRDVAKRPRFYNHMRGVSVRSRISPRIWNSYYKFCFERNPWDKVISFYYWVHRHGAPETDINDYILSPTRLTQDQRLPTDWGRYAHDGRIILDDVYDFSDLEGGLRRALAKAGVDKARIDALALPRLKTDVRPPRPAPVLDEAARRVVRRVFAREIERFGYLEPALAPASAA